MVKAHQSQFRTDNTSVVEAKVMLRRNIDDLQVQERQMKTKNTAVACLGRIFLD
jgi:hypothetical protein